jgi:hypothetical protein
MIVDLDNQELKCPHCSSTFLHHGRVVIYDRAEDQSRLCRIIIENRTARQEWIENHCSGNPSARRDGLAVAFWCEGCGGTYELTIAQHKGVSLVDWR